MLLQNNGRPRKTHHTTTSKKYQKASNHHQQRHQHTILSSSTFKMPKEVTANANETIKVSNLASKPLANNPMSNVLADCACRAAMMPWHQKPTSMVSRHLLLTAILCAVLKNKATDASGNIKYVVATEGTLLS